MKKLEALIKKVRRLGFGRSYDVGASEYYRLEAEFWLTRRDSRGKVTARCQDSRSRHSICV